MCRRIAGGRGSEGLVQAEDRAHGTIASSWFLDFISSSHEHCILTSRRVLAYHTQYIELCERGRSLTCRLILSTREASNAIVSAQKLMRSVPQLSSLFEKRVRGFCADETPRFALMCVEPLSLCKERRRLRMGDCSSHADSVLQCAK